MSKQFIFGVTLSVLLGAFSLRAQPLSWPPGKKGLLEQGPLVTLVGPVYESGLETEHPWHQALLETLRRLGRNPQLLPNFYRGRIRGMRHFLFRPGYKNDEEWGSIKTLQQSGMDDPERIAAAIEECYRRFERDGRGAEREQPWLDPSVRPFDREVLAGALADVMDHALAIANGPAKE